MNKEEILKRLQEIIDLLNDENAEDVDTEALEEESRQLNEKLKEINKMEERKRVANGINNGTVIANNVTPTTEESRHYTNTLEYRKAFKDYVLLGKESAELRENQTTMTTDIGAVIPNTIVEQHGFQKEKLLTSKRNQQEQFYLHITNYKFVLLYHLKQIQFHLKFLKILLLTIAMKQ